MEKRLGCQKIDPLLSPIEWYGKKTVDREIENAHTPPFILRKRHAYCGFHFQRVNDIHGTRPRTVDPSLMDY